MIVTVTPNPLLDYVLHFPTPPSEGGHRLDRLPWTVGGKGINVARLLKTLGRPAQALTFAGGPNGTKITEGLREEGIVARLVPTEAETRAGINFVIDHPPAQTWWLENGEELRESEVLALLAALDDLQPRMRYLALSGTIPGRGHRDFFRRILERARPGRAEVYLDTRGEGLREALRVGGFFLKHNRDEARETFGLDPLDPDQRPRLLEELARAGVWGALFTDGPRPCLLWDPQVDSTPLPAIGERARVRGARDVFLFQPPRIDEVSAVGSGDAALAGILFGRVQGFPLSEAVRWGLAAGAADAGHSGPCEASAAEVESLLSHVESIPG